MMDNTQFMYSNKYKKMLEPIILPNGVMLRNRLASSPSTSLYIQGNLFSYPTEAMMSYIASKAKAGAALITLSGTDDETNRAFYHSHVTCNNEGFMPYEAKDWYTLFDFTEKKNHIMFSKMTEMVHILQSKIVMQLLAWPPAGYDVSPRTETFGYDVSAGAQKNEVMNRLVTYKEMSKEMLHQELEKWVEWAKLEAACGFDGVMIHCSTFTSIGARLLQPIYNKRTDEYGGSIENRSRWVIELAAEIKKVCGNKFIVEVDLNADDRPEGGNPPEEIVEFAKLAEGVVDIISVRHWDIDASQASTYESNRYPALETEKRITKSIKKAGIKIPVNILSGFHDPDDIEALLEAGEADMIHMGRGWFTNIDYIDLVAQGRGEDITPCLRCSKCLGLGPYSRVTTIPICSVNPLWGLEDKRNELIEPPKTKRNIGIIGGGPSGLRAAIYAADRGHDVTVYEKSDRLGGLLKCVDGIPFKWALTKYKEWLIRQVDKRENIKVVFNTEIQQGDMREKGHDGVIVAMGGKPVVPDIPGIERALCATDVMLGNGQELGKNVVIIGGGDVGLDCGMDLAQKGHNVFVIEMLPILAATTRIMHSYSHKVTAWRQLANFDFAVESSATLITDSAVEYVDKNGEKHSVAADSVLYAVGVRPTCKEGMQLIDMDSFVPYFIGDCRTPGSLAEHNRAALGAACAL